MQNDDFELPEGTVVRYFFAGKNCDSVSNGSTGNIGSTKITISTQNVNGYSENKDFLHNLCNENQNSIRDI